MPYSTPLELLLETVESTFPADPTLLSTAWMLATRENNIKACIKLASRDDFPATFDATLENHPDAAVRAAFTTRVVRTQGSAFAEKLRGETRATVLAKALVDSRFDPVVVDIAGRALVAKPTQVLVRAFTDAPPGAISPQVAYTALLTWAVSGTWREQMYHDRLVSYLDYDFASQLLRQDISMLTASKILPFAVEVSAVEAALDRYLNDAGRGRVHYGSPNGPGDFLHAAGRFYGKVPSVVQRQRALRASLSHDRFPSSGRMQLQETPAPWPPHTPLPVASTGDTLRHDALSQDPQRATRALQHLLTLTQPVRINPLANPLLRSKALTPRQRYTLVEYLGQLDHLWDVRQLDIASHYPDEPDLIRLWVNLVPDVALRLHGWEPFGGPTTAPNWVQLWTSRKNVHDQDALRIALRTPTETAQLLRYPVAALSQLQERITSSSGSFSMKNENLAKVSTVIAARLGDVPSCWAVFTSLYDPESTMTLDEMLNVATGILA